MSKKAMAPYALFMVAVIGISLLLIMTYLGSWSGSASCETLALKCTTDQKAFCTKWWTNSRDFDPNSKPDWKAGNICKDKDTNDTIKCKEPSRDDCVKLT